MHRSLRSALGSAVVVALIAVVFGGCGLDLSGLGASAIDGGVADGSPLGDDGSSRPDAASTCSDGAHDGTETDVDCGGPTCAARCPDGDSCGVGTDCQSKVCDAGTHRCDVPTCSDGQKNGMETDVDCGGPSCPKCGDQEACAAPTDCMSMICTSMKCVPPSCADHMKDGNETDVDCGGPDCAPCGVGQGCATMRDCTGGSYCDPVSMTCATQGPLATACTTDAECTSGNCVDAVCCDTAQAMCNGCMACNVSGDAGHCTAVPLGQDPHDVCTANATTCESDNCQGAGTCTVADGIACEPTTCTAGAQTTYTCESGACTPAVSSCGAYDCTGTACATACTSDAACTAGYYCDENSTCQPQKPIGSTCDAATDCKTSGCAECQGSGGCVDGYCCSTACNAACQTCAMAAGAPENGVCGNVPAGRPGSPSCAPLVCNGGPACPTACSADSGCVGTDYCASNGLCKASLPQGSGCDLATDCKVPASCRECSGTLHCDGGGHCN